MSLTVKMFGRSYLTKRGLAVLGVASFGISTAVVSALGYAIAQSPSPDITSGIAGITDFLPSQTICMVFGDRKGCVDFGGDKITYSGELPFDEAAKVLFDHIGFLRAECKK